MSEKYRLPLVLVCLSLTAGAALIFGTRWGVGLSPDSAIYIGGTRNLLDGNGFSVSSYPGEFTPVTQYPPLFSALLAAIGLFGVDPVNGARWLNALLFTANVFLVGNLVGADGKTAWAPVFASFLMMTSVISLKIHSMAWSEPLFIFLVFLAFFFLAKYLEDRRLSFLVSASFVGALAALTRYAGVVVIATAILAILLWSNEAWSKRSEKAAVFLLISAAPLTLWVVRNLVVAETVAAREIGFHPITVGHLEAALDSAATWFLPGAISSAKRLSLLAVLILFTLIFVLARREKEQTREQSDHGKSSRLCPVLTLFIILYAAMLVGAISFLDAYMPIDNRYLYPVYVATLVLAVCLTSRFAHVLAKTPLVRVSFIVLCLFFSGFYLTQGTSWLVFSYHYGAGYSSRSWRGSKLIARVHDLDPRVPVFTNAPDAIYLLTGRPASMLPRKVDTATGKLNGDYPTQLVAIRDQLGKRDGILVYFKTITWRWYLPREEELGLSVLVREEDGSIYQVERKVK